jgi:hypothetical protein
MELLNGGMPLTFRFKWKLPVVCAELETQKDYWDIVLRWYVLAMVMICEHLENYVNDVQKKIISLT